MRPFVLVDQLAEDFVASYPALSPAELETRLGLPGLWPLAPEKWDEAMLPE